jgi:hypothetical protein
VFSLNYSRQILKLFIILVIGLSLGHTSIKSDYDTLKEINSDAYVYMDIAKSGYSGISNDHRSTRLLIPLTAHYLSKLNPLQGKYNKPQTNLFIVTLFIFTLTTYFLIYFLKNENGNAVAFIGVVSFFLHFITINQYFLGIPDSMEFLCSLFLFFILINNKYIYLLPLFALAALNRESFFLYALPIIFIWSLFLEERSKKIICLFYGSLGTILFLLIVFLIKNTLQGNYETFTDGTLQLIDISKFKMFTEVDQIRNLLYSTILLIPLGLIGLYNNKKYFFAALTIIIVYFIICGLFVGSGAALGRYLFSSAGPILILGQAKFLFFLYRKSI